MTDRNEGIARDTHARVTDRIKRAEAFPLQNPRQIVPIKPDWRLGDGAGDDFSCRRE